MRPFERARAFLLILKSSDLMINTSAWAHTFTPITRCRTMLSSM